MEKIIIVSLILGIILGIIGLFSLLGIFGEKFQNQFVLNIIFIALGAISVIIISYKGYSSITGGTCEDVKKYLNNKEIDVSLCNLKKQSTDQTNLTKEANKLLHPNMMSNQLCASEANKAWQSADEICGSIINSQKKSIFDFFSSSNNTTESRASPAPSQSYNYSNNRNNTNDMNNSNKDYSNMSDYELNQASLSGDVSAMREKANRQPIKHTKLNPDERPSYDFCSIM